MAEVVAEAVRALARGAGARGREVLALEGAALDAAALFGECRAKRAYATLVPVPADGGIRPMVLVKVELRGRRRRRTVLWKGGPLLEQLLRGSGWPLPWAEALAAHLSPATAAREAEVWAAAAELVAALKEDPEALAGISARAEGMRSKERSRQEGELRQLSKALVKGGWSEAAVLRVWREEQCREVQDS